MARSRVAVLRTVGLDIAGPLVVYRVAVSAGMPQVWALVLSGLPPGINVFIDWLRWRTLEVVGAVVLGGIALNFVLALTTGNTRTVLLEGAITTAGFGVLCWLSLARRRPLIFYFAQAFYGGPHSEAGAEMDTEFEQYERARWFWRTVTIVWGIAYVLEAILLGTVAETAGTSTALAVNKTVPWLLSVLLIGWAMVWGNRLRRQKAAADEETAPADVAEQTDVVEPQAAD